MKWSEETSKSLIKFLKEKSHAERSVIFTNELLPVIDNMIKIEYDKGVNVFKVQFDFDEFRQYSITTIYEALTLRELPKLKNGEYSGHSYIRTLIRCFYKDSQKKTYDHNKRFEPIENYIEENQL